MKTLIIGLFGLALVTSSAAWGQPQPPKGPPPGSLPKIGAPAICTLTEGIIVIVLKKTGDVAAFACSDVNGKPITKEDSVKSGMKLVVDGTLGTIKKYKLPSETDPCITWDSFGTSKTYCW